MSLQHELPFAVDNLLNLRVIEGNRVEFKASWNDVTRRNVIRSICAFANDVLNLNGGYIVLGAQEVDGRPSLPPAGLGNASLDRIQREIFGDCKKFIFPEYQPMICVEHVEDRPILVLCCPGGDARPYSVRDAEQPGSKVYYVRQGAVTARAENELLRQLLEVTARVPFDDRRNLEARIEDLSPVLIRRFLHLVGSQLLSEPVDDRDLLRRLRLTVPMNGHGAPRNVGLLFFSDDPDRFLPGARIEVVRHGHGGDLLDERIFRGPLNEQVQAALRAMEDMTGLLIQKVAGQPESIHHRPYPPDALREAVVNAVYHRGYEGPPEPVKVYLYPDRIEIISYPGPLPGIRREHLGPSGPASAVPARNRRVGDFLKELRMAEARGTGVPKIWRLLRENGSPPPEFDFDEGRSYFRTTFYPHKDQVLAEAENRWIVGLRESAIDQVRRAAERQPGDLGLTQALIQYQLAAGQSAEARRALDAFARAVKEGDEDAQPWPFFLVARWLLDHGRKAEALSVLSEMPSSIRMWTQAHVEQALLVRQAGDPAWAMELLDQAGEWADRMDLSYERAATRKDLAAHLRGAEREQLLCEAMEILEQALRSAGREPRGAQGADSLLMTMRHLLGEVRHSLGLL